MSNPRIAIDAMGGDHAPEEIVAGALLAANEYPSASLTLFGDEPRVRALLRGKGADRIAVVHAPETVPMDQHASQALRSADRTSLGMAVGAVKSGQSDAVVSAGNSGAFLAIALIKLRTIEGVARPAIATVWPAMNGPTVLLDSGANVDCRAEWLEQFGDHGFGLCLGRTRHRESQVALLSIGEERTKGNSLVLEEQPHSSTPHQLHRQHRRQGHVQQYRRRRCCRWFRWKCRAQDLRRHGLGAGGGYQRHAPASQHLEPARHSAACAIVCARCGAGSTGKHSAARRSSACAATASTRTACVSRRGIKQAILTAITEVDHDVVGRIGQRWTPHLYARKPQ